MSAFNDLSYLNNAGLQHLNDRLHNTFRVTAGQNDYANLGNFATSSGYHTNANGKYSYAEGYQTSSLGYFSHSEGLFTNAIGDHSHAEGQNTYSNGYASHAEGYNTRSFGNYSHAEGNKSLANVEFSHAEGGSTIANGLYSHAEGSETTAFGHSAHAEGAITRSYGAGAHSEGRMTLASGDGAHAEGSSVVSASHSSSKGIISYANGSHAEGRVDGDTSFIKALGLGAHAEGYANLPGQGVNAYGVGSHAEGGSTGAIGDYSHAEGYQTYANGNASHSSGYSTHANGDYSHAEGYESAAIGNYSHAEGSDCFAYGNYSHAEGMGTNANGNFSHAEGSMTESIGAYSHSEGRRTQALSSYSHAGGIGTIANTEGATVFGKYSNDAKDILFGIGNGNDAENRSSCFEITTDGFIRQGTTKIKFGEQNSEYGFYNSNNVFNPFGTGGGSGSNNRKFKYIVEYPISVVVAYATNYVNNTSCYWTAEAFNDINYNVEAYRRGGESSYSDNRKAAFNTELKEKTICFRTRINNDPSNLLKILNSDTKFFIAFNLHGTAFSRDISNYFLNSDNTPFNYYYGNRYNSWYNFYKEMQFANSISPGSNKEYDKLCYYSSGFSFELCYYGRPMYDTNNNHLNSNFENTFVNTQLDFYNETNKENAYRNGNFYMALIPTDSYFNSQPNMYYAGQNLFNYFRYLRQEETPYNFYNLCGTGNGYLNFMFNFKIHNLNEFITNIVVGNGNFSEDLCENILFAFRKIRLSASAYHSSVTFNLSSQFGGYNLPIPLSPVINIHGSAAFGIWDE